MQKFLLAMVVMFGLAGTGTAQVLGVRPAPEPGGGMRIASIEPGTLAAYMNSNAKLFVGDVIISVNGNLVRQTGDISANVKEAVAKNNGHINLIVRDQGNNFFEVKGTIVLAVESVAPGSVGSTPKSAPKHTIKNVTRTKVKR